MIFISQKKYLKFSISMDKLGIGVAALCAAHCVLLPILISSFSLIGLASLSTDHHSNEWLHWFFIALSIFFAMISLGKGYLRHKNTLIFCLAILGSGFLITSAFPITFISQGESLFVILGSLCLSIAHMRNWKIIEKKNSKTKSSTCL